MQKVRGIETWFDHYCTFCDPTELFYVISPAFPAIPRWRPFCSYRRRGCRYPAWWRAGCGRGYPPPWPHPCRPRSSDWRRCAGGNGRSALATAIPFRRRSTHSGHPRGSWALLQISPRQLLFVIYCIFPLHDQHDREFPFNNAV